MTSVLIRTAAGPALANAFKRSIYDRVLELLNNNEPNDMTYARNQYQFNSFVFVPPIAWQRPGWSDVNNIDTNYDFLRGGR